MQYRDQIVVRALTYPRKAEYEPVRDDHRHAAQSNCVIEEAGVVIVRMHGMYTYCYVCTNVRFIFLRKILYCTAHVHEHLRIICMYVCMYICMYVCMRQYAHTGLLL